MEMEKNLEEKLQEIDNYFLANRGLLTPEEEYRFLELLDEARNLVQPTQLNPETGEKIESSVEIPLELAKLYKKLQLKVYDNSTAVNSFYFKGQTMWLTPNERANNLLTVQAAEDNPEEYKGVVPFMGYELPIETVLSALKSLDLYAFKCAVVTETHTTTIENLESVEAVENYDFTVGYPEKIHYE
jgi:hypothetical protein